MLSTHPFEQEEVMAYLDGEISAGRATDIALHLQRCAECQSLAETLHAVSSHLSAWQVESSPARLTRRVAAAAHPQQAKPPAGEVAPLRQLFGAFRSAGRRPWAWAGAGALATLLLLTASLTTRRIRQIPSYLPPASGLTAGKSDSAAELRARSASLQALQQKVEQETVASSLENEAPAGGSAMPSPPPPTPGTPSTPTAPMIARTASLSITAKDFGNIESTVKAVTSRYSGYIGELSTSSPTDAAKTLSATLHIPSARLDAALAELKQLGRVDEEKQSGEEVTKAYVDLAANLKNSRATEQRLLDVLRNNTGKVKDVLEVETEISRVRGEIEQMEADQRALQSRIDFATVELSLTEEFKASLNGTPTSMGTRLHNSFVEGYHALVESIVGFLASLLEVGPTLLLWATIFFLPARWAWKRIRRSLTANPVSAA